MVKLSELKSFDIELYNLFLSEAVRLEGFERCNYCVMRDVTMASILVFRKTSQGADYWWDISSQVERMNSRNYAKV
jgi:hypothetical protein